MYGAGGPPATDGQAIAALVCGILGFVCIIPAIVAIVLGAMSRGRIERSNGQLKGQGMATAGMILGIVSIVAGILIFLAVRANN
jgi:hypothetical protein